MILYLKILNQINCIYKTKLFTESREYFFRDFVFHFLCINDQTKRKFCVEYHVGRQKVQAKEVYWFMQD